MKPARIMIVDDDPDMRASLRILLEARGYEVLLATNGKDALAKLGSKMVDLILLDFYMPEMTGLVFCDELRNNEAGADVKVIFLSVAGFETEDKIRLQKLGISSYIQKPFDSKRLLDIIEKVIGP